MDPIAAYDGKAGDFAVKGFALENVIDEKRAALENQSDGEEDVAYCTLAGESLDTGDYRARKTGVFRASLVLAWVVLALNVVSVVCLKGRHRRSFSASFR